MPASGARLLRGRSQTARRTTASCPPTPKTVAALLELLKATSNLRRLARVATEEPFDTAASRVLRQWIAYTPEMRKQLYLFDGLDDPDGHTTDPDDSQDTAASDAKDSPAADRPGGQSGTPTSGDVTVGDDSPDRTQ